MPARSCASRATDSWSAYERYLPDDQTLAGIHVPVHLLVSADTLPMFAEIAPRLGACLGVDVATTPGRHDAYAEYPSELAAAMRPSFE